MSSLVLAMGLAAAGAASAADQLRIFVNATPTTSATGPVSDFFAGRDDRHLPLGRESWTNSAAADYGKLGASSRMSLSYALADTASTFAQAGWQAAYSFQSPTGAAIPISMNLVLEGSLSFEDTCSGVHAGCELSLTIDAGFLGTGDLVADNGGLTRASGFLAPVASQFRFDGSRFTIPFTTNTAFVFGNGTPVELSLALTVSSLVSVNGGGATTKADFIDTLSFPIGGVALNLPAGSTVSGPGLINNCFGGAVACGPPCGGFSDVDPANPLCANVEWVKNRQVTLGCAPGLYCPSESVIRLSMAAFMNRLGTAGTGLVLSAQGQPGAIELDASPVVCQTADFAVVNFPRRATVDSTFSGEGAASVDFGVKTVASFDGGTTWLPLTIDNVAGSATAAHWGNIRTSGMRDLDVGQTVRFGVRVDRGGLAGSSGLSASRCNLRAAIDSRITDYSPLDP